MTCSNVGQWTVAVGQWDRRAPHVGPSLSDEKYIYLLPSTSPPHTYLDGVLPFLYLGVRTAAALHSTATLSAEGHRGLYGSRLMHRRNIFRSCSGHSGWAGSLFLCRIVGLTLTLDIG